MTTKKLIGRNYLEAELERLKKRISEPNQTQTEVNSLAGSIITVRKMLEMIE